MVTQSEETVQVAPTIKERLLSRFFVAKDIVGSDWKTTLSENDPFFDTKKGVDYLHSVSRAVHNPKLANVDRIERVTMALEKIANIKSIPVC